jgi:tetratricopeptide (TPR) repeat protein
MARVYSIGRKWEAALQASEAALNKSPKIATAYLVKAQSLVALIYFASRDEKTLEQKSVRPIREMRLRLEQAQESLSNYLRLLPNNIDAVWWHGQLEAMKAHIKQLKDQEDGVTNILEMTDTIKPVLLYKEKGKYTEEALRRRITGTVILRAIFDIDGSVRDLLVIMGLDGGLSWKAIEAARKIRHKPAIIDGQPVAVIGNLEFSFEL